MRPHPARPCSLIRHLVSGLALAVVAGIAGGAVLLPLHRPDTMAVAPAEGVVRLNDGRSLEGDVVERGDEIVITVNGITTTLARDQVANIEYGSPEQRLKRRLDALAVDDLDGRLGIAEEGLRRGLLDFAEQTATAVRMQSPNNARAAAVIDQVGRQREIRRVEGTGKRASEARQNEGNTTTGRTLRASPENVLSEEQINLVRQAELQDADVNAGRDRPGIQFRNNVIRRYVESDPELGEVRDFNRRDDVTKALTILRDGTDNMWPDVRITSDPSSIREFLRSVEPVVINGCATSECHGGTGAGSFVLFPTPRDDAPTRYTNFYILNTTSVGIAQTTGAFGEGAAARRLIDRDAPEDSILLHYMLPAELTKTPHPRVEDYQGVVRSANDENYRLISRWIAESLESLPSRGYGFEFKPNVPQTQPAASTVPDAAATTRPDAAGGTSR